MDSVTVLLVVFAITLLLGVPVVWSIGLSSVCALMTMGHIPLMFVAQRMFTGAEKYTLLAIFFYMLAGAIMQHGGISRRLVDLAKALTGHVSGGLSIVTIVTCIFFGALSGSSIATTAAIGAMLYPELVKAGYPKGYSASLPVLGGTMGIVIPPSIVFIVYGTTVNTSVSKLLISGIGPGVLAGVALCIYAYIYAKVKNFPHSNSFSVQELVKSFRASFWALMMPVIILGGIYTGIFTPTESAAVAVVYGLIVSSFIYRELNWETLLRITIECVKGTANIMLLIMVATVFGWILTRNNVPALFTNFIASFIDSKIMFILFMNVILLILGMIMDSGAIILIVAPLLYPIAMSYGIDPVHLGCIIVFNLAVGQATPPFGNCLFAATTVTEQSIIKLSKASVPGVLILFATVLLTSFIPAISMGLIWLMD
jgi:C4-dicarboxylate transporter DctM subunit